MNGNARESLNSRERIRRLIIYVTVFPMLGTIMFASDILMEALPNIHIVGALVMIYTLIFRFRALVPLYIYVFLNGIYMGFSPWWVPYLYIWTILWAVTMLLPKNMPKKIACVVYPAVCALHGFLFGLLYSPAQAVMFGLDFEQLIAWITAGLPFDAIHGVGNFVAGLLILPVSEFLRKLFTKTKMYL